MRICLIFLILFSSYTATFSQQDEDVKSLLSEATELMQAQEYSEAVKHYQDILSNGVNTADLHYNLANAYFESKQLALSILHYEKALKLEPNHPSSSHNLKIAQQQIESEIVEIPAFFLLEYWNGIIKMWPPNIWAVLSLIGLCGVIYFIYKWLYSDLRAEKKKAFFLGVLSIFLVAILFLASLSTYRLRTSTSGAILMHSDINLKTGPDERSNDVLIMSEGTKLMIQDSVGLWYKVKLRNNDIGWIEKDQVAKI